MEDWEKLRIRLVEFIISKFYSRPQISVMADDIVNEAFVDVLPNKDKCNFGYLSKVCVHKAYRMFRQLDNDSKSLQSMDVTFHLVDESDVVEEILQNENAAEILSSLEILRQIERIVVVQRYYGDYSFSEIANKNNIKLNTVLSHHRRALEKLRTHLSAIDPTRNQSSNISTNKKNKNSHLLNGGISMFTEKQVMKFGLYAERAHRLAFDVALAAAELGQYGRGMAIVSNEMRSIGNQLYSLFDHDTLNVVGIIDAVKKLKALAFNGDLEIMRLHESQLTLKKRLAVILDEIRVISVDIECCFGIKQELPLVRPRLLEKNLVLSDASLFQCGIRYLLFAIGNITFCEAVENVKELFLLYPSDMIMDNHVNIRGVCIPVLNYYEKLLMKRKPRDNEVILVVSTEYEEEPKQYAVIVDSIPIFFYTGIGRNTAPLSVPSQIVRECWNCEENLQMVFLNYGNFNDTSD